MSSGGRSLAIVHAIARLNLGGAALHVAQLAAEQERRGHRVVVVAGTIPAGEESMEHLVVESRVPHAISPAVARTERRKPASSIHVGSSSRRPVTAQPRAAVARLGRPSSRARSTRPAIAPARTTDGVGPTKPT